MYKNYTIIDTKKMDGLFTEILATKSLDASIMNSQGAFYIKGRLPVSMLQKDERVPLASIQCSGPEGYIAIVSIHPSDYRMQADANIARSVREQMQSIFEKYRKEEKRKDA